MLSDAEFSGYDEEMFYDALGAALDAILPWVPKTATATLTGDGSSGYALPSDLYEIAAIVDDDTGELLPHSVLIPGSYRGINLAETNDWLEYPHGYVSFSKEVTVGETYTLYYLAHWTKPTGTSQDSIDLEPPDFTNNGLVLYSTAYMLFPSAVSAAEVRQFNTKVDSGNPEHNPMQRSATYLIGLFMDEMNRHPRHQKAQR